MTELTYRLDMFEGPLDLLLTLISKNKVKITDIPIAMICDQYMQYIEEAQSMDLEIASEKQNASTSRGRNRKRPSTRDR